MPVVADASTPRELHLPGAGVTYSCGPDAGFVLRVDGDTARVHLPGREIVLTQVPADSGALYTAENASFSRRGSEAVLEVDGTTYSGCRSDIEPAPWMAARERGVQFRAVGQEPGWHLEITEGERAHFVSDYGETTWSGRMAEATVEASPDSIRWTVVDGGETLVVVATDEPCFDDMSGEPFPATVTVFFRERGHAGCGRFLR